MVLAGSPTKRWHLIEFANNFTHKQGILTVATVLPKGSMNVEQERRMRISMKDFYAEKGCGGLSKGLSG